MKNKKESILILNFSLIFGKGGRSIVYIHPDDPNKCVKIDKKKKKKRRIFNKKFGLYEREVNFYKTHSHINLEHHLPKCYGIVKTNKGPGLCYELIRNDNGEISYTLKEFIKKNGITYELKEKYNEIIKYFIKNKIYPGDANSRNILVQMKNNDISKLIIVDGFNNHQIIFMNKYYQSVKKYLKHKKWYYLN
jgi:hypothetical protein